MKQIPNNLFFAWVEKEIAEGRSVQFRLKGVSMYPLIREGKDEVLLSPCSHTDLNPMDVILFKYNGRHLLHRIIRTDGHFLYIQGDGSVIAKEKCLYTDVVGKVEAVIRPSGKRISINNWRWQLPSFIWTKSGIFRTLLLKTVFRYKWL